MELSQEQQQAMVNARQALLAEVAAIMQDRGRVVAALSASTVLPLPDSIAASGQQVRCQGKSIVSTWHVNMVFLKGISKGYLKRV